MKTLFLFLLLAAQGFAAIASAMVWELRTTGVDTNGGGYKTGASGTDYSQQDAAQLTVTDGASSSTTNLNSVAGGFTSNMVGNVCQISGGTLTAGFYEITAYVDTNNVTVDRALNTGSGSTVKVGGALLTPEKVDDGMVAGNICFIKYHASNTYSRAATWSYVGVGIVNQNVRFVGYDTNRLVSNSDANRPTLTISAASTALITGNGANYTIFTNIYFLAHATPAVCFASVTNASTASNLVINCKFSGFTNVTTDTSTTSANYRNTYYFCEFTSFTGAIFATSSSSNDAEFIGCYFHDSSSHGIYTNSAAVGFTIRNCIFDTLTGYGIQNNRATSNQGPILVEGCIFYNNTSGGIFSNGNATINARYRVINNIFWGKNSADYGIRQTTAGNEQGVVMVQNNAFGNFATTTSNFDVALETDIVLTAIPFTDAPNQDFTLNNDAGGGVLLRALAWPRTFPGSSTTEYRDVGATQHKKPTISN